MKTTNARQYGQDASEWVQLEDNYTWGARAPE